MKSMTGFGRAVATVGDCEVCIDISSVNRKGLDVSCNLPKQWASLERLALAHIKTFFSRGKVNVSFRQNLKSTGSSLCLDEVSIKNTIDKLRRVCESAGIEFNPNAEALTAICLKLSDCAEGEFDDEESVWKSLEPALIKALENINAMREVEARALASDILARLGKLSDFLEQIKCASKTTVEEYKEQLLLRLKNLDLNIDLSDERFLKEVCLFADKCDISEEITRLSSHIAQFETCVKSSESLGRKMDFICQEMGREINTIGSKANNLVLTKIVIDFKNELERIREQAQNIE